VRLFAKQQSSDLKQMNTIYFVLTFPFCFKCGKRSSRLPCILKNIWEGVNKINNVNPIDFYLVRQYCLLNNIYYITSSVSEQG